MDEAYRSAVAGWMRRRHGWEIQPGWIINAFGVVHAVGQAVQAFTQPGEGVIFQTPAYPPFLRILQATGRTPLSNPLLRGEQGYTLDFEALEALCARPDAKLLLFCSPHNPTGRVWSEEELRRVADICARNGVLLFSDEIHFDFIAPGHRHTVLATLDEQTRDNCIVGTSASKTFNLAGLSTANIIIPNDTLRRRFRAKTDGYTGGYTGYFGLTATRTAYEKGEAWLDALLVHLEGNFRLCREVSGPSLSPLAWVAPWEGTYSPLGRLLRLGSDGRRSRSASCGTRPGCFWMKGTYSAGRAPGFERMVLACPRLQLERALERLDQAAAGGACPVRPCPPGRAHSTRNTGSSSAFWAPPFLLFLSAGPPPPLW